MSRSSNKLIGITMGDPSGIGPEVIAKALANPEIRNLAHFIIIGDFSIYKKYSSLLYPTCIFENLNNMPLHKWKPGQSNRIGAKASFNYLKRAIQLLKAKEITALVTAPVCKETISMIHPRFLGHTEFLADAFHTPKVGMMFVSKNLKTILVTRHLPLHQVSKAIHKASVYDSIQLAHHALKKIFKIKKPVIVVCGLNPHAGEGGILGREEIKTIIPAIKKALAQGISVQGPWAADTLFLPDKIRHVDAVVAMYHDQGLIPIKTLAFNRVVNLTVGLPFIRTSPAHGTAFDIAGKNKADSSSMEEAIKLAVQLS